MKLSGILFKGKFRGAPSKQLGRKEKRKAERKLKKKRRNAYTQRKFELIDSLKNVDTALKAEQKEKLKEKNRLKKIKKKKKREEKTKSVQKEEEDSRVQGLRLAIKQEEKELKQLEKNLKFRKKKGKTSIPTSFSTDGLDYILDATESDKIKDFDDIGLNMDDMESSENSDEEILSEDFESDTEKIQTKVNLPDNSTVKSILKTKKSENELKKSVKFNSNKDTDQNDTLSESEIEESDYANESDENNIVTNTVNDSESEVEESDASDKDHGDDNDNRIENSPSIEQKPGKRKRSESTDSNDEEELKEDIYGRLRDSKGNVVQSGREGAYIPPAKRAMLSGQTNEMLKKQVKGLVNRVSEGTMQVISTQLEALYLKHSRADMNETLTSLVTEALVSTVLTPERLVTESAMLVAILHTNVGSEVGAFFLQKFAKQFHELLLEENYGIGKKMENILMFISNMYNFKIVHSKLVFDIMNKFITSFQDRDIELILLLLRTVGFSLRKDDPLLLKEVILSIQSKANTSASDKSIELRTKFMLETLTAIKNNNMRKIPSYDPTHLNHLRKVIKALLRGHALGEDQLSISLEDLLKADEHGRWWIVGSAWEGKLKQDSKEEEVKPKTEIGFVDKFNKKILKLAKKLGMNTDVRRHIFCIIGTSEDYEEAFTRLVQLKLNHSQEREIIHIILHCCLSEQVYNPFYGYLAQRFCSFDRRFTMTVQFSMWDKFKEVDQMEKNKREKFGKLLSHLLVSKSLSLSVFKVVEFGMENKHMIRLLTQVLTEILLCPNETTLQELFQRIAPFPKLKTLHQGLQVFMHVHLKNKYKSNTPEGLLMEQRVEKAESAMFNDQSSNVLLL